MQIIRVADHQSHSSSVLHFLCLINTWNYGIACIFVQKLQLVVKHPVEDGLICQPYCRLWLTAAKTTLWVRIRILVMFDKMNNIQFTICLFARHVAVQLTLLCGSTSPCRNAIRVHVLFPDSLGLDVLVDSEVLYESGFENTYPNCWLRASAFPLTLSQQSVHKVV